MSPTQGFWSIVVAASATLLLGAASAGAQNVIPGGRFDGGIDGYTSSGGPIGYSAAVDRDDESGSGSLQVTDDNAFADAVVLAERCVSGALPPGGYYLDYWTRFPSNTSAGGNAAVSIQVYSTSNCSGAASVTFTAGSVSTAIGAGLWIRARAGSISEAAEPVPPGSLSYRIRASVNRSGSGSLTAYFDDIFFAPVGKPLCGGLVPTIGGGDAGDSIVGTSGTDVIVTFGGNDTVFAGGGTDFVCGGDGDDTLHGEGGKDALFGQAGGDKLYGGSQSDLLRGGADGGYLDGEGGGRDICVGGTGVDFAAACEKSRGTP